MFTKTRETTRGSGATYPSEQPHDGDGKLLSSSCYSVVYKAPRACSLKSPGVTVLRWYISVKRDWNDRNDVTKGSWDPRVTMRVGFCSENNLYCFRTYFWPEVFMNISLRLWVCWNYSGAIFIQIPLLFPADGLLVALCFRLKTKKHFSLWDRGSRCHESSSSSTFQCMYCFVFFLLFL